MLDASLSFSRPHYCLSPLLQYALFFVQCFNICLFLYSTLSTLPSE